MKQWLLLVSISTLLAACGGDDKQAAAPKADSAPVAQAEPAAKVAEKVTTEAKAPSAAEYDKAALVEEAKVAVQALGGNLMQELQLAMKAGGPLNAIPVCNEKAPEIANAVSTAQSLQISRVSLKNRNPVMGKANDWQTTVLQDFDTRKAAGESPDTLAFTQIIEHDGKSEFRFMKAIPTGGQCLGCHGANLEPAVSAKIAELYPEDKAVGYKEGDLRGAFVVVKSLN